MCKGPHSTRARMNALYELLSVNLRRALCGGCVVLLFQVRKLRHRGNIELAHIHSERPANSEPKPNAVYTKSGVCILHVLSLTGSRSSCLRVKAFMLAVCPLWLSPAHMKTLLALTEYLGSSQYAYLEPITAVC